MGEGIRGRDAPAGPRAAAEELVERGAGLAKDAVSPLRRCSSTDGIGRGDRVGLAEEHDAAVVVVGTGGHGPVKSAVPGSVSQEVVHDFRRPTLVV